jgi:hypothetical protein
VKLLHHPEKSIKYIEFVYFLCLSILPNVCHTFFILPFTLMTLGSKQWGFVTYHTSEEAMAAVDGTKDDNNEVGQLEKPRVMHHNSDFRATAKLSWARLPGKGIAFVKVT